MKSGKTVARFGLLVALALILSYLESLLPFSFGVPGIKLGLPNLVVIFALYRMGVRNAAILSLLRVALASILFGSVMSFAYSAVGAALSLLVMWGMKTSGRFGTAGVSVAGALAHNFGQILTAALLLETSRLAWYLPALCISGTAAGRRIQIEYDRAGTFFLHPVEQAAKILLGLLAGNLQAVNLEDAYAIVPP